MHTMLHFYRMVTDVRSAALMPDYFRTRTRFYMPRARGTKSDAILSCSSFLRE